MDYSNITVLIVEDSEVFRKFLHNILTRTFKVNVIEAVDPMEAFEILQNQKVSLIILDMEMPKMDGYTFLKKIRAIPEFQFLPVIACSALRSEELIINLAKLNIVDYIAKPAYAEVILKKVHKVLNSIAQQSSTAS